MIRVIAIIALCLISGITRAQSAQDSINRDVDFSKTGDRLNKSSKESMALLDVLFATNEACDLYINSELKGTVTKNEYKLLKLASGVHTYKARSKSSADELIDSFTVKETGSNEIFIDLLYFIDEKKAQSENSIKTATANPLVTEKKTGNSEEAKMSAINAILSNMVAIKGGSFVMGNNNAPSGDEMEHPVSVSSVLFSKYEVTQQQWESMMGFNPSENKNCSACPVENVSWEEVIKFIKKLNIASNKRFRLPTEAEWEYVAKIGGKTEIENAGGQEEYIRKTAWYFANSDKKTHPVGEKQPNILGIYDLYGNVSEWCSDWYGLYFYKEDDNQKDPEGPPLGREKVIRGGSYIEYVGDRFRPSLRNKLRPTTKSKDVGFRLVLDVY